MARASRTLDPTGIVTTPCRVAMVTNIPAPYRLPVYNAIGPGSGIDLHVIFCSAREPNREWDLPALERPHVFLKERFLTRGGHFIHCNFDVLQHLNRIRPDVVITTGFNPTHLLAAGYAVSKGLVHIPMTDGTVRSEMTLGPIHRLVRGWVYRRSRAFLAASNAGLDIYRAYGCPESRLFRSVLCVNNDAFCRNPAELKPYDFLFCGRLAPVKNPLFVLEVARLAARGLARRVSVCFVGGGPMEAEIRRSAGAFSEVEVHMIGFAAQNQLPQHYGQARIFLLPSLWDPWGVVANEACASGLPVITSPHAGVAGELVKDGVSGYVRELDAAIWADAAVGLLRNEALQKTMSRAARRIACDEYTFSAAAGGIVAAVRCATISDGGHKDGSAVHR